MSYPLNILDAPKPLAEGWFATRPIPSLSHSLESGASHFIPSPKLKTAINVAIALGEPLLVTGEPGTGKTQVAYYVSHKLGLGGVLHFQVKSSSKAQDLLYDFDLVRYFHDAHLQSIAPPSRASKPSDVSEASKMKYITKRPLWEAFEGTSLKVLLIDEIDKAPRDFPNDLLLELDQMRFEVPELKTNSGEVFITAEPRKRPIVIITSNSERRLPEPFLRRCIYHHMKFDQTLIMEIVMARRSEYPNVNDRLIALAVKRFLELRERATLRKKPSTGELLTWLRIMQISGIVNEDQISGKLSQLPFLDVLLKDNLDFQDIEKV